ncbi:class I SAM-dependent methyltransferase [soil metagenome]
MRLNPVAIYNESVLPRLVDVSCANPEMEPFRRRAVDGLSGTIVEIGFGSGPNVPVYPPEVTHVYAVEPSELARRRATARIERERALAGSTVPVVEMVGLDGQDLALPTDSCDGGLSTFTLCTVPDVERALAELRRVIRPGGTFHFLEHGSSPDAGVAKWQRRLEPMQRRMAGGCHLTRDTTELVRSAGFTIESVDHRYARGPKPWTWFTVGAASNPA